jgi:DsbE subfamily thiol:disulfide oxidoreductase
MARYQRLILLAVLLATLAILLNRFSPSEPAPTSVLIGKKAPTRLPPNRPVLVNFFASWCVPCKAEIPSLLKLKESGITIYGIAVKDRPADTATFLATTGNPYTDFANDSSGRIAASWHTNNYPQSFMVDSKGIVRFHQAGFIRADQLPRIAKTMRTLAAEPDSSALQ